MKKIFSLCTILMVGGGMAYSQVVPQDVVLNIDANDNHYLAVGQTGYVNVVVSEGANGSFISDRIGVQLSVSTNNFVIPVSQPLLPAGSTICSNTDGTIIISLPAFSGSVEFKIAVEGTVVTDASSNISSNIVLFNGSACVAGPPLSGDDVNNNSSSTQMDVIAATPVTLISFTGRAEGSIAVLDWATAEETEFSHFEIESSADALSFQKVGEVFAKGSNNNYTFSTAQNEDLVYYRLKMVDHDGSFAYSKIIPVSLDESTAPSFLVYPNPTVDYLHIKNKEAGVVRIIDVTGKQIRNEKVDAGIQVIDVKNLREGVYYGWMNEQSFKFVKK
jgi:hypothetical protein